MSHTDNEAVEMAFLKKCQRDLTESYFALLLRILKKLPNCTYTAAEEKIFEDLKIPEINSTIATAAMNSPVTVNQSGWDVQLPTETTTSTATTAEESKTNLLTQRIEEIRRSKGMRYRDAVRAIRLQMLIDHILAQSSVTMSQVQMMQVLTDKLNHLYELTPPPEIKKEERLENGETNDERKKKTKDAECNEKKKEETDQMIAMTCSKQAMAMIGSDALKNEQNIATKENEDRKEKDEANSQHSQMTSAHGDEFLEGDSDSNHKKKIN